MISVGQKFLSYEELQIAIEEFEFSNNVKFMKLKTVKMNNNEFPTGNEKLVYKSIIFQCIRGGPYIKRGRGLRNRSTEKQDCPAHINLRISNDAQSLIVRSIGLEHNHEILEKWIYFKDGISRSIRRKLNLKKMFMRRSPCQMDGHVNLYAALIEPKALEALQNPAPPRKRRRINHEQEGEMAAESLCLGEVSTFENVNLIKASPADDEQYVEENELPDSKPCVIRTEQLYNDSKEVCDESEQFTTENEQCIADSEQFSEQCIAESEQFSEQCITESEQFNEQHITESEQFPEQHVTETQQVSSKSEHIFDESERSVCDKCASVEYSTLLENQKTMMSTLGVMSENIQILNKNMLTMANALNNLVDKIGNITHVVLKKVPC